MMSSVDLSRQAAQAALRVRAKAKIGIDQSFCVIDLAGSLGLEVQFVDLASLEGAYFKGINKIMLSTFRPDARVRFTCGHELGHHVFGHGDHFDELVEKAGTVEAKNGEIICDQFSSYLLMPLSLVRYGYNVRGCDCLATTPLDVLRVSSWIGVGYETLINQMCYGLNMIPRALHDDLKKAKLSLLKQSLIGKVTAKSILFVDEHWVGRPLDLAIGDHLVSDEEIVCDIGALSMARFGKYFVAEAIRPCVSHVKVGDKGHILRIRRSEYIGRAKFRHLEEVA